MVVKYLTSKSSFVGIKLVFLFSNLVKSPSGRLVSKIIGYLHVYVVN